MDQWNNYIFSLFCLIFVLDLVNKLRIKHVILTFYVITKLKNANNFEPANCKRCTAMIYIDITTFLCVIVCPASAVVRTFAFSPLRHGFDSRSRRNVIFCLICGHHSGQVFFPDNVVCSMYVIFYNTYAYQLVPGNSR